MIELNTLPVVKKENEIAPITQNQNAVAMLSPFGSIEAFETAQRMALALAKSTFVPKEFKNNIGDCLILLETASRTDMPIMALMQSMYVVHGKPAFSSAFMAGLINNSKRFDAPLQFKYNKARTSCYAHAKKDGQEYRGITITIDMAKKEGWTSKKGSKWVTMPELMLQYRATSFFARAYCADLIMGMRERHEVEDAYSQPKTPKHVGSDLNAVITPTDQEKDQAIEVEEVVKQEKEHEKSKKKSTAKKEETEPSVNPKYEQLMSEASENSTADALDTWRMKHANRITKAIPDPEVQGSFFTEVEGLYQKLKAAEEGPDMIECPQGGTMPQGDCEGCEVMADCKARKELKAA